MRTPGSFRGQLGWPTDAEGEAAKLPVNPLGDAILLGSVPGTCVTDDSDHIGNTFARHGFLIGSNLQVSASK